jgi:hypothetical protein
VGAFGGIASLVPAIVRVALLVLGLAVLLGFELAGRPLNLPQNRRLVPQSVIPRANVEGPLQFGFEMGTGVRTFMPTALPHALVLTVALLGGVAPGLLAGLGFGIGRALMPLTRSRAPRPDVWDKALLLRLRLIGRLCAVGFLAAAVGLLSVSPGW